jgi:hypothetical protein
VAEHADDESDDVMSTRETPTPADPPAAALDVDLDAIRRRLAAATPGPWSNDGSSVSDWRDHTFTMEWTPNGEGVDEHGKAVNARARADADLIAHAPADLAACLARIAADARLLYLARHADDPAVLGLVTPAALEAWLTSRGWTLGCDPRAPGVVDRAFYARPSQHPRGHVVHEMVWVHRDVYLPGYGERVGRTLAAAVRIEGSATPRFEALAAVLPERGVWDEATTTTTATTGEAR